MTKTTPAVLADSSDPIPHRPPSASRTRLRVVIAIALVAVGLLARWPLLPYPGFLHDQDQFVMWAHVAATRGVSHVYDRYDRNGRPTPLCNYPPVQVYVCRALASVYPLVAGKNLDAAVVQSVVQREEAPQVHTTYVLFKMPAVAADLATAVLLLFWLSRRGSLLFSSLVAALYALHPAVLHDSSVWGQIDAIPTLFILGSLEAARRKNLTWMWTMATLASLAKPQALIFLPVWLTLSVIHLGRDSRRWMRSTSVAAIILIVTLAPFHGTWDGVREAYAGAPSYYPFTHLNGFSAWFLKNPLIEPHLEGNLVEWYLCDDRPQALGLTARSWGLAGVLCTWLLAIDVLRRRKGDEVAVDWAARLVSLGFFVFSTQMHERYLFPAIAIWAGSARPNWRWWTCWLALGGCVAINMLWVWIGPCSGDFLRIQHELFHRTWFGQPPGVWCSEALIAILLASIVRISTIIRWHPER